MDAIETIDLGHDVVVKLFYDEDPMSPEEWDQVGEIAYLRRSRYRLGTEDVSEERMDEIAEGIRSGELLGLPVYAYVHSGATIRCGSENPFPDQEWDSGMSGFVYCTVEKGLEAAMEKELTPEVKKTILGYLRSQVEEFDQYLTGQVYGFVVEHDGAHEESCWGFYGLDYAREEAKSAGKRVLERVLDEAREALEAAAREEIERAHWEARDVVTR